MAKTFLACIGTRPEIVKMAPVCKLLKARGFHTLVIHTGQHAAIAYELYRFFDMMPDKAIDLQRKSPSLGHLTSALLDGIEPIMSELKPDVVMVQGDTSSALVGALMGYYHDKPVAHIEAGLRTRTREPFPEEKNRELIGRLARWHFAPTEQAKQNLLDERISPDTIYQVGNTVIDAALWTRKYILEASPDLDLPLPDNLRRFLLRSNGQPMILVTAHRRENWGKPIGDIAEALATILIRNPDTVAVWPVHPNPAVKASVISKLAGIPQSVSERICLTEPLGYPALIHLLDRCHFTLTDSGGIQEEASAFAKPVLIARESTERQELVEAGGALLVGTDVRKITAEAERLLNNPAHYQSMQVRSSPFGDGKSAERIVDTLTEHTTLQSSEISVIDPIVGEETLVAS